MHMFVVSIRLFYTMDIIIYIICIVIHIFRFPSDSSEYGGKCTINKTCTATGTHNIIHIMYLPTLLHDIYNEHSIFFTLTHRCACVQYLISHATLQQLNNYNIITMTYNNIYDNNELSVFKKKKKLIHKLR